jgi:toxin ParE1/3/4
MPRSIVRPEADLDVDEIADYIGQRNPSAGRRFILAAKRDFDFLARFPRAGTLRGHVSRNLQGLRSWPIKGFRNYLIFYQPIEDGVDVIRVLHGARDVDSIIART